MSEKDNDSITLSRRKALLGIGGIGAAGLVGGFGTQALFSDTESTSGTFTAGDLDLQIGWEVSHYGNNVEPETREVGDTDGASAGEGLGIKLNDVKPGDSGWIRFEVKNLGNPSWVWFRGRQKNTDDNGSTDAEVEAEGGLSSYTDGAGKGELQDHLEFRSFYDWDGSNTVSETPDTSLFWDDRYINKPLDLEEEQDTSGQYGSTPVLLDGIRNGLDGSTQTAAGPYPQGEAIDPFPADQSQFIVVRWSLPYETGNEVQTDSIEVCFDFYAEQERHNPEQRFRGADGSGDTKVQAGGNDNADYPDNPWDAEYSTLDLTSPSGEFATQSNGSGTGLILGDTQGATGPSSGA